MQGQTQIGQGGVQFDDLNMTQLSKEVQSRIMPLQALNSLNSGTNDGGLFNVSPSIGMQNIPNITNMAATKPTLSINNLGGGAGGVMSSISTVVALNVGIPNVPPNMIPSLSGGSSTMALAGSVSDLELGMGMGSVINATFDDFSNHIPSLAFDDPAGFPVDTAGATLGTVGGTAGLTTIKLESIVPQPCQPNLLNTGNTINKQTNTNAQVY